MLTTLSVEVPGFDCLKDLFSTDPFFSSIMASVQAGEQSDFLLHDGFLLKGNQLSVPDCCLSTQIIRNYIEKVMWDVIVHYNW